MVKVLESLSGLNEKVENLDNNIELLRAGMSDRFAHMEKKIEAINQLVRGGDGEPGIIIRLDRLEVAHANRRWVIRAAVAAALTALADTIYRLIARH